MVETYIPATPGEQESKVETFTSAVNSLVDVVKVKESPEFVTGQDINWSINRFYTYELKDMGPRLLLLGSAAASESIKIKNTYAPRFEPRISTAKRFSRHGVFFGDLTLDYRDSEIPVAVRMHKGNVFGGADDLFRNEMVTRMSVCNTKHLGIQIDDEGNSYVISKLENSLKSIDSRDWRPFRYDPANNPGMQRVLSITARKLAYIHSLGIRHGDVHPRNIAETVNGNVFHIDWETARFFERNNIDASKNFEISNSDHESLIQGLTKSPKNSTSPGIGIFDPNETPEMWWKKYQYYFLDYYMDQIEQSHPNGILPKHYKEEIDEIYDSSKLNIYMQHDDAASRPGEYER